MKTEALYIWLQQSIGLCNRVAYEVLSRFNSIVDVYNCNDFSFLGEKKSKYIDRLESKDVSSSLEVLKKCKAKGIRVIGYYDELYPERLKRIDAPPVALYAIGQVRDLNTHPSVAIVGTRKMTDYGRATAERFAYTFAKSGAYVISGLAKGVDTAAHRGAVMADGYTIAVLGVPIGEIYPKENEKAFETLYERGLVISEMYPDAPRTRADFPNRNRIISGLSDTVVVAEAGTNSGALITARYAINQGRSVFAVPGAIGAENAGTNSLIKQGIPIATEPMDVLGPLALEYPKEIHVYEPSLTENLRSYGNVISKRPERAKKEPSANTESTKTTEPTEKTEGKPIWDAPVPQKAESLSGDNAARILDALKGKVPLTADELSARLSIPVSDVMTELTLMEIDGSVIASVGGRYLSSKF